MDYYLSPPAVEERNPLQLTGRLLRVQRVLLAVTVVGLPVAYVPGVFADPVNIPKLSLLLGVVALAVSLRLALTALGQPFFVPRRFLVPTLLLSASLVASWIASPYTSWASFGVYTRFNGAIPYLAVVVFALLVADAFKGRPTPVARALVGSGAAVATFGLVQMFFLGATVGAESETGWITSTLGHSNFAGGYLALTLPLAVGLWLDRRTSRWGLALTAGIGSALMFTFSQGAWIGAGAGVVWLAGTRGRERGAWTRWLAPIGLAAGFCLTVGTVLTTVVIDHPYAKLPGFFATATSRGFLWETALATASERPLLGWGPNGFAVQGPLHRTVEDALLFGLTKAEDPHSLPLAVWTNLGLVGLAALVLVGAAVVGSAKDSLITQALRASLVAYVVQSLVSVDVVSLRFGFWTVLAALATSITAPSDTRGPSPVSHARKIVAALICVTGLVGGLGTTLFLAVPDARAQRGEEAFRRNRVEEGRRQFSAALDVRAELEYRRRLAMRLGHAALALGEEGQPLIDEMSALFAEIEHIPDVQVLALHGSLLNEWSVYEPEANARAIAILQRAQALDPNDPVLATILADALVQEGRPAQAERELLGLEHLLTARYPEFRARHPDLWAGLAIAQAQQGKSVQARETLASAPTHLDSSCRQLLARELLKDPALRDPRRVGLACPPSLARLLMPRQRGESE